MLGRIARKMQLINNIKASLAETESAKCNQYSLHNQCIIFRQSSLPTHLPTVPEPFSAFVRVYPQARAAD